jgi:hypothetical protein
MQLIHSHSPFLALPTELRCCIYEYTIGHHTIQIVTYPHKYNEWWQPQVSFKTIHPAEPRPELARLLSSPRHTCALPPASTLLVLGKVSKQVRAESTGIFFARNTFDVYAHSFKLFTKALPSAGKKQLRKLKILQPISAFEKRDRWCYKHLEKLKGLKEGEVGYHGDKTQEQIEAMMELMKDRVLNYAGKEVTVSCTKYEM